MAEAEAPLVKPTPRYLAGVDVRPPFLTQPKPKKCYFCLYHVGCHISFFLSRILCCWRLVSDMQISSAVVITLNDIGVSIVILRMKQTSPWGQWKCVNHTFRIQNILYVVMNPKTQSFIQATRIYLSSTRLKMTILLSNEWCMGARSMIAPAMIASGKKKVTCTMHPNQKKCCWFRWNPSNNTLVKGYCCNTFQRFQPPNHLCRPNGRHVRPAHPHRKLRMFCKPTPSKYWSPHEKLCQKLKQRIANENLLGVFWPQIWQSKNFVG